MITNAFSVPELSSMCLAHYCYYLLSVLFIVLSASLNGREMYRNKHSSFDHLCVYTILYVFVNVTKHMHRGEGKPGESY